MRGEGKKNGREGGAAGKGVRAKRGEFAGIEECHPHHHRFPHKTLVLLWLQGYLLIDKLFLFL